jgi:hypothetical protein
MTEYDQSNSNNKMMYLKLKHLQIQTETTQTGGNLSYLDVYAGHEYADISEIEKYNQPMTEFLKAFETEDTEDYDITYPFNALQSDDLNYSIENIVKGLIGKGMIQEKFDYTAINFPKNITQVYWYQKGIPDQKPWLAIVMIKYKKTHLYGYFEAMSCYTGFDVCGDMGLTLSKDFDSLMKTGIPYKIGKKIVKYLKKNKYNA